jgi:multiple sugar transport system permease protein
MGHETKRASSDSVWLAVLLLPVLLLPVVTIILPAIGTFISGFMQDVTFMPQRWAGSANYLRLINDPAFYQSLRFTLLFIAVSVPLELVCGLLLALLMQARSPFRGIMRALVLIPWAIPAAIAGRVWELIYNYNWGTANHFIRLVGAPAINWLGSGAGAFLAIVIADLWKTIPFVAIILLAGLSAIPDHLYWQAEIDGATFLRRFFAITLPLLRPVLIVAVLFRTIDALRIFDLIYILTSGGPGGATASLSLLGYTYFVGGDFGYGSAISTLIFIVALLIALTVVRIGRFGSSIQ